MKMSILELNRRILTLRDCAAGLPESSTEKKNIRKAIDGLKRRIKKSSELLTGERPDPLFPIESVLTPPW